MTPVEWILNLDRFFDPDPATRVAAREIYVSVADLPIVSPHGHVDVRLFAQADSSFGTPCDLLIIPDHYVFRMLYSQGIPLETLGVPTWDGSPVEKDHRKIWQTFAENFHLFRGTPTGVWLAHELHEVFGVGQKLTRESAQAVYDQVAEKLASPAYRPRALFECLDIEVMCTTDAATDTLAYHQAIQDSGWSGRILPTFRPDAVIHLNTPGWKNEIQTLSQVSGVQIHSYATYVQALEQRRTFFKQMGAVATDHAALTPFTTVLSSSEVESIFQRAMQGQASDDDAIRFAGHMLIEMARMSTEDGLVMQFHPGSLRNHNSRIFSRFGLDKGADMPLPTEYTRNLWPLLESFGNDARLTLILFALDESTYGRELAPLAGHYPALKLGPPWWFFDSPNGMKRYFDQVMETAGIYNTAGFNDDTRSFPSIPARHDLWRRASSNWLAGLVTRHMIDMDEAIEMAHEMAYGLAKRTYRLES